MDRTILILTYFLVTIGIVMIFSASSVQAKAEQGQFSPFFEVTGNVCGFGDSSFDFWN